jgi:hypothetical protein
MVKKKDRGPGAFSAWRRGRRGCYIQPWGLLLRAALLVIAFGANGSIGTFNYAIAVFGLGFSPAIGLSGCNSVPVLLGDSSVARPGVGYCGSLTVVANGLASSIFITILAGE